MNVGSVLDTVEQTLLSRHLSSLERFIFCQSWLGRGYSEMAPLCAYSIAHIKDIGSQLWQTLSTALGEKVTKKNLFLVLKQYLFSWTDETVTSEPLSVSFSEMEETDSPLMPTTNQLPAPTDLVAASYLEDSEQLPRLNDCCELVTQEDEWLLRVHQEYQNFTENTEAEDRKYAPVTQNQPTIKSDCLFLNSPLYIHSPMEKFIYTEISQLGCALDIKAPKLQEKSSLLSKILNRAIHCGYKTINMDFQEADDAVCAKFNQFLYWVVLLELFVT